MKLKSQVKKNMFNIFLMISIMYMLNSFLIKLNDIHVLHAYFEQKHYLLQHNFGK